MKKFLIKILAFFSILLLYVGVNTCINYYLYTQEPIPKITKNILITGDSHPQTGVNPSFFHSAENVSLSGAPYVLTFWQLKKLFKESSPDTLILGFAPHNISNFNDLKFSHPNWSPAIFKRSYLISNFGTLKKRMPINFRSYYETLFKQFAIYPRKNHIHYVGNFIKLKSTNLTDWRHPINRHYYFEGNVPAVSEIALSYLDSIAVLCDQKEIDLVLVSHPVHAQYYNNIPANILKQYEVLKNKFGEKYFIVDKTHERYPDSLFLNYDHLNGKGAAKFTQDLIEELDKQRLPEQY